jgi:hypothetical protein
VEIVIIISTMTDLSYYECMKMVTKILAGSRKYDHRIGTNEEKNHTRKQMWFSPLLQQQPSQQSSSQQGSSRPSFVSSFTSMICTSQHD